MVQPCDFRKRTIRGETIRVAGVVVVDIARGIHIPRIIRIAAISAPQTHVLRGIAVQRGNLVALDCIIAIPANWLAHAQVACASRGSNCPPRPQTAGSR